MRAEGRSGEEGEGEAGNSKWHHKTIAGSEQKKVYRHPQQRPTPNDGRRPDHGGVDFLESLVRLPIRRSKTSNISEKECEIKRPLSILAFGGHYFVCRFGLSQNGNG